MDDDPDHLDGDIVLQAVVFHGVQVVTPARGEIHPEDILVRTHKAGMEDVLADSVCFLVRVGQ